MQNSELINGYIVSLLMEGVRFYLPTVGTIYISESNPPTVLFDSRGNGDNIIDLISSRYGISDASQLYSEWLGSSRKAYHDYVEYTFSGLGRLMIYPSCAIFNTEIELYKQHCEDCSVAGEDIAEEDSGVALNEEAQEAINVALAAADVAPQSEYTLEDNDGVYEDEDDDDPIILYREDKGHISWRTIAISLAVALVGVSAISAYYFGVSQKRVEKIVEIVRDTVIISVPTTPAQMIAANNGRYHIVAGAFENKELADKLAEEFVVKGYDAIVFFSQNKGYHIVSVISGNDKEELQRKMATLPVPQNQEPFWIYEFEIQTIQQ